MNEPILILPSFYPYQFAEGETPLIVMERWAKKASKQDQDTAETPTIVESSGQDADSTIGQPDPMA
ncbi:MAG TPA: hypothetical protein VKR06_46120 [Ktedonosporobacter sp.]|nr:hypothetical protein [Ktedonosporobacter sp.]